MTRTQRKKRSTESISIGPTGALKIPKDVLAVGNALVREFKLDQDGDLLGKWLAHDLASKLEAHKRANGEQKKRLAADCRETILTFWKHRAMVPRGHRPFEGYEAALRALESLDPESPTNRYFHISGGFQDEKKLQRVSETEKWLEIAKSIDRGARGLISFCIASAAEVASEGEKQWLKAASVLGEDEDVDIQIVYRLEKEAKLVGDDLPSLDEIQVKRLQAIRDHITAMCEHSKPLLKFLNARIKARKAERRVC